MKRVQAPLREPHGNRNKTQENNTDYTIIMDKIIKKKMLWPSGFAAQCTLSERFLINYNNSKRATINSPKLKILILCCTTAVASRADLTLV